MGRRAFTLIELLLTTTLLILAVSFVVIAVENLVPSFRIEGAARELGTTVADVQATAAVTGRLHGVVYDLNNAQYWILAPPETEDGEEDRWENDDDPLEEARRLEALEPFSLHDGVNFKDVALGGSRIKTTGRVKILFEPNGAGPPHAVHLIDEEDNEFTVEVNPFAGTVEFREGFHAFDIFIDDEE